MTTCLGIHGRIIPFGEIAYFTPLESAPAEGSVMHLTDGSLLNFPEFSVRDAEKDYGFIYLPKDKLAFSFTTGEIIYDPEHLDRGPTTLVFRRNGSSASPFRDKGPELMLEAKTSADEIDGIIAATEPKRIPVYTIYSSETIEADFATIDYTAFKRPARDGQSGQRLVGHQRRLPSKTNE